MIIILCLGIVAGPGTVRADLIDDPAALDPAPKVTPPAADPAPKATPEVEKLPEPAKPMESKPAKRRPTSQVKRSKEPIYIQSNSLSAERRKGYAEFEKFSATQADMKLESDKAKVYSANSTDEVVRVEAHGHVKMTTVDPDAQQPVQAHGNEAIFYNETQKVILKGDAELKRGTNVFRGDTIVYELNTGWIKVQRFDGVVQPGEKK